MPSPIDHKIFSSLEQKAQRPPSSKISCSKTIGIGIFDDASLLFLQPDSTTASCFWPKRDFKKNVPQNCRDIPVVTYVVAHVKHSILDDVPWRRSSQAIRAHPSPSRCVSIRVAKYCVICINIIYVGRCISTKTTYIKKWLWNNYMQKYIVWIVTYIRLFDR